MRTVLICLACLAVPVWGQIPVLPTTHYQTSDGLSQNTVWCITRGAKGFLWIGTSFGLNRFDGTGFVSFYSSEQENSIPSNEIRALAVNADGRLWLGTTDGLALFDTQRAQTQRFKDDALGRHHLGSVRIWSLLTSQMGLLLGTADGVYVYDHLRDDVMVFRPEVSWPERAGANRIRSLVVDRSGLVWAGSENGLFRINTRTGELRGFFPDGPSESRISHQVVRALALDGNGTVWIGTSEGLTLFNQETQAMVALGAEQQKGMGLVLDDDWINGLVFDDRGQLWIATRSGGVSSFDSVAKSTRVYHKDRGFGGLSSENIVTIFPDRAGLVWMGAYKNGLVKVDTKPMRFHHYKLVRNEAWRGDNVQAILGSSDGSVWIGNQAGLTYWNREAGIVRTIRLLSQVKNVSILAIAESGKDRVWAGTYGHGLLLVEADDGVIKHFPQSDIGSSGLPNNYVQVILPEPEGTFLLGTRQGVCRFDPISERFSNLAIDGVAFSDSSYRINALLRGQDGRIWIGSDRGLIVGNPNSGKVEAYVHEPDNVKSLSHDTVNALYESVENGCLWIGTNDGIHSLNLSSGVMTRLSDTAGFPSGWILGIAQSSDGLTWFSTNSGLYAYKQGLGVRLYDHLDGLQDREFNRGAFFVTQDGTFMLGGPSGFNLFHPDRLYRNKVAPELGISSIRVFDREISFRTQLDQPPFLNYGPQIPQLVLQQKDNFFTIDVAVLDFQVPRRNRVAYQLKGVDPSWIENSSQDEVAYSYLKPGDYLLLAKGCNNDGVWSEAKPLLQVRILAPFYRQKWFFALLIVLFICGGAAAHLVRLGRLRQDQVRIQALVDERTAELDKAHNKLAKQALLAGRGEITTGILHNVGNMLNSVGVSVNEIAREIESSPERKLHRAGEMVEIHSDELAAFFGGHKKGKLLLPFFHELHLALRDCFDDLNRELKELSVKMDLMKKTILTEQNFANRFGLKKEVNIAKVCDEILRLMNEELKRLNVVVHKKWQPTKTCRAPRHALFQVFLTIVKNAVESMESTPVSQRRLEIDIYANGIESVVITVKDSGEGIEKEEQEQLFSFGYTTKTRGTGFGLSSCKRIMEVIGGSIQIESDGRNQGTRVMITVPFQAQNELSPLLPGDGISSRET